MVSTIDTITLDGDDEIDISGWIRTFADSGKPSERDALTVLKLLHVAEEIHVHVSGGELRTDHGFSLGGRRFLTLRYEIERLAAAPA